MVPGPTRTLADPVRIWKTGCGLLVGVGVSVADCVAVGEDVAVGSAGAVSVGTGDSYKSVTRGASSDSFPTAVLVRRRRSAVGVKLGIGVAVGLGVGELSGCGVSFASPEVVNCPEASASGGAGVLRRPGTYQTPNKPRPMQTTNMAMGIIKVRRGRIADSDVTACTGASSTAKAFSSARKNSSREAKRCLRFL